MTEASTITMICSLKGVIDIVNICEILPVYHPKNSDGTNFYHPIKTRNKIPYFNVPNVVICVKYKGVIRGIRQNEGQMNNVISIDLQCCNKNINLKLAKSKIQLTGANSEEMGNKAFNVMCDIINQISEELEHKESIDPIVKNVTVAFLLNEMKGEDDKIKPIDFNNKVLQNTKNIDLRLLKFLYSYHNEFSNYSSYQKKIEKVLETNSVADMKISVIQSRISNSVYNYSLGKEISLISITNHLHKKGFNVSLHNWNSSDLKVSIPIEGYNPNTPTTIASSSSSEDKEEDEEKVILDSNDKIKVHRFIIYRGGSIKQTSPTNYKEAIEAKKTLMKALEDF